MIDLSIDHMTLWRDELSGRLCRVTTHDNDQRLIYRYLDDGSSFLLGTRRFLRDFIRVSEGRTFIHLPHDSGGNA